MYHSLIKDRIRQQGLLHSATLELTYACNLDCFFCYNEKDKPGSPLQLPQYMSLLDDLAAMNVLFVSLTGGEPMIHPEFFAIAAAARERGFVIRVKTGGHSLRNRTAVRLKEEVDPFQVEVSLHGATAATHERQTRVAGSFSRLLSNLDQMQSLGLRVTLVSTLTAWNEAETEAMFKLADDRGLMLRWQGPVSPRDDGDMEPTSIQPSLSAWQHLYAQIEQRLPGDRPGVAGAVLATDTSLENNEQWCGAGSDDVLIDPFGSVYPCLHLRWEAGNLHQQSIQQIWNQAATFGEARQLSADTALAMDGQQPEQLGAPMFCPGLDEKLSGCGSCSSGCH